MTKPSTKKEETEEGDVESNIDFFSATDQILTTKGTLFYHESDRAWNTLRLKKEVLHEFPNLKNKENKCIYLMKLHRSYDSLKKDLEQFEKKTKTVPIILFLGNEKEN